MPLANSMQSLTTISSHGEKAVRRKIMTRLEQNLAAHHKEQQKKAVSFDDRHGTPNGELEDIFTDDTSSMKSKPAGLY